MSEQNATNEIKYEFPTDFYDKNKTAIDSYLTKQNIKHTIRTSKSTKNPHVELTIPSDCERRFQLRMQLLKIKVKEYKK